MKVAVFASYLPPHVGGLEIVARAQIRGLAEQGQDVQVITSACGAPAGEEKVDGYTVRRIPALNYFEEKMGAVFPIFSPSLLWHSYRVVKHADVVYAHDAFYLTSLAAAFWAFVLRKPMVLMQHVDMIPHPRQIVNVAQELVYATTGRFILRTSKRVIILNDRVKEFLVRRGVPKSRIVFLPNGVDTQRYAPATAKQKQSIRRKYKVPEDTVVALFVGRFVPKKGFTKLIDLQPIENLTLIFAGGDAPAGHKRSDHRFLGLVNYDYVADIFKMADIFVLPSEGEGFPVTIEEALSGGLATITTDDPAYEPYGLTKDVITLIQPQEKEITKALSGLTRDSRKRKAMGEKARAYALKHFSWQDNVSKLLAVYEEVRS